MMELLQLKIKHANRFQSVSYDTLSMTFFLFIAVSKKSKLNKIPSFPLKDTFLSLQYISSFAMDSIHMKAVYNVVYHAVIVQ